MRPSDLRSVVAHTTAEQARDGLRAGQDDGAGARVNLALLKKGIIVRPVGNYGLPQWLRVSIGLPEENAAFLTALKAILA